MAGSWIRPEKRLAINLRDNFTCAYCGCSLSGADPSNVTLDHLVPRNPKVAHGNGGNEATNLVTACKACNSSRQDKPSIDYATGGARDRIETLRYRDLTPFLALAKSYFNNTVGDAEVESAR